MADHKYIRREGSRGNYKYIYEEDLKNTRNYYNDHTNTKAGHKVTSGEVQGPPEVSKEYLEAYRANTKKNDYTPHVVPANNIPKQASNQNHTFTLGADGTTVPVKNIPQKKEAKNPFAGVGKAIGGFGKGITSAANNARRDVKNAGSKLVMGANGAVNKVKDTTEDAGKKLGNDVKKATNKVSSALSKFFGGGLSTDHKVSAGNSPKAEPKRRAAETRKASVKSIENDKASVIGADYLKKAASKGLTKGDDLYDQFEDTKDIKIVGDKNKIEKAGKYLDKSITAASLQKTAGTKRKEADDAYNNLQTLNDEFDKKRDELESSGAPMTKLDTRHYLKDKRFRDMLRLEADGEEVTDEQMYAMVEEDPYISIPTGMEKDWDKILEESYKYTEKEHAARRAEYMANIMNAQAEKYYQKEMKDIDEDDFEYYQNGKRIPDDGEISTSHRVKEK